MNSPLRKSCSLMAALAVFSSLTVESDAVVIILFEEVGADVQAKVTGSLDLSSAGLFVRNTNQLAEQSLSSNGALYTRVAGSPSYDTYSLGSSVSLTSLLGTIASWSGTSSFGYDGGALYVPHDTPELDPNFTPTGTWTWANTTISGIGLGSLTSTPEVVYTTAGGDTIQYALVPEPSPFFLLGLGSVAFFLRRSRH